MAFTTEFVMGAGGGSEVDQRIYAASSLASGTVPLGTYDAGDLALLVVEYTMTGPTSSGNRPHIEVGGVTYTEDFRGELGSTFSNPMIVTWASGVTQFNLIARSASASSITARVFVIRDVLKPARYLASDSGGAGALLRGESSGAYVTMHTHTVTRRGVGDISWNVDFTHDQWVSVGLRVLVNGLVLSTGEYQSAAGPRSVLVSEVWLFEGDVIEFQGATSAISSNGSLYSGWDWSIA